MQHMCRICFPPVFPSVGFFHPLVLLTIQIKISPGDRPHAISVESRKFWNIVPSIFLVDRHVQPVNFLLMVDVSRVWEGPIVLKPCQLWWIHQGGDGDGILHLTDLGSQYHVSQLLQLVHDVLLVIVSYQVVVSGHDTNVQRPAMLRINILYPESICEGVYTCTWYGKVVSVQAILVSASILADITVWWGEEHVQGAV